MSKESSSGSPDARQLSTSCQVTGVDWSQNDAHKTTVTVYSVRARERPSVSTPVTWQEVESCRASGDPELLSFDTDHVLARVAEHGDLFAPVESLKQRLPDVA